MERALVIGEDLTVERPLVQGGMGVGISLHRLAGTVASQGGLGIISTAQIGFKEPDFDRNPVEANMRAIHSELDMARALSGGGAVGFNIMAATRGYESYVREAVKAGADIIVSGAGLPVKLPEYAFGENISGRRVKLAPIVSSERSADVILKLWDRKYHITADMLVVEGPLAGGHLGFTPDELEYYGAYSESGYKRELYDEEIRKIIAAADRYSKKYNRKIPVVSAGGIYDREAAEHAFEIGADGVQLGTLMVTTEECDAPEAYKQAYLAAAKEDIRITQSPVGMPGRAIANRFLNSVYIERPQIRLCHKCLEKCDMASIPYCITDALIAAASGDMENALIFSGAGAYRADKIRQVADIFNEIL